MPILLQKKAHNEATSLSSPSFIMRVPGPPCRAEMILDTGETTPYCSTTTTPMLYGRGFKMGPYLGESSNNKCTSILIYLFVHSSIFPIPGPAPNPCCLSK
ncbi:hypothetical protein FVEG_16053 [Fusarium verticillioides 7600]|uniref:Uncharacterized protein n=1 Tax=Gibberella moniliformis (strain M3125 / FGSC 7600) TaxID=334819 RepID=W7MHJ1_GIBM7|nr:hypothetical protein FVEG_16053 [Fusarium verticillioides 7600]EWG47000.1 hypothetical protein FVEG_16053 [Fusarium verticillioides 7600]